MGVMGFLQIYPWSPQLPSPALPRHSTDAFTKALKFNPILAHSHNIEAYQAAQNRVH